MCQARSPTIKLTVWEITSSFSVREGGGGVSMPFDFYTILGDSLREQVVRPSLDFIVLLPPRHDKARLLKKVTTE